MLYANVSIIIIETIVNSMKTRHVSKVIDVFKKNLFMSIRHMKKKKYKVPMTSLSLHWAIYLHKPV